MSQLSVYIHDSESYLKISPFVCVYVCVCVHIVLSMFASLVQEWGMPLPLPAVVPGLD